MRIFHVDPERTFFGGEVQVSLLMEGLRQRGHDNVLVCAPDSQPDRRAKVMGFETRPLPIRNNVDLPALLRLRKILIAEQPDLVHLHTGRATWIGGWAARWTGCPAVSTRRMDRIVKDNWRTRQIYGHLVLQTAAISPAVLKHLRRGGVPVARTRLIWSSIDPVRVKPTRVRDEVRREFNVAGQDILLLAVGNLTRRKGFDLLIAALAQVRCRNVHLLIAGSGKEHGVLSECISEYQLHDRVQLLGQRTDIPDLLAACDLFVMPSRAEGLGVAALEAMAAGRPVIASKVGGLSDVILHGTTGLLVPPEQVPALSDSLNALIDSPVNRANYGEAGRARVSDHFHVDQMVCAYEELYSDVLLEWSGR